VIFEVHRLCNFFGLACVRDCYLHGGRSSLCFYPTKPGGSVVVTSNLNLKPPLPPRKKSLDFTITCRKAWGVHAKDYHWVAVHRWDVWKFEDNRILMLHPRVRVLSCMTYSLCWITYITDSCETKQDRLLTREDGGNLNWSLATIIVTWALRIIIITTVGWCHHSRFHLRVQTFGTEPCCLLADDQVKYLNPDAFAVINGRLQARSAFQNPSMIYKWHTYL